MRAEKRIEIGNDREARKNARRKKKRSKKEKMEPKLNMRATCIL